MIAFEILGLDLVVGDCVEIRIVDVSTVDAPESIETVEQANDASEL